MGSKATTKGITGKYSEIGFRTCRGCFGGDGCWRSHSMHLLKFRVMGISQVVGTG